METLTETSLKRMHLQFERKVKLNRELRIKFLDCDLGGSPSCTIFAFPRHVDDPDKFLKSEVDLDEEIKKHLGLGSLGDCILFLDWFCK